MIVIDSDSGGNIDEDGGVSLLSSDEGLYGGGDDEEEEDKDMATLPKSWREPNAEEHMDCLNNNTGSWHSELVRLEKPSRWLVRVEGASKLLL